MVREICGHMERRWANLPGPACLWRETKDFPWSPVEHSLSSSKRHAKEYQHPEFGGEKRVGEFNRIEIEE